jgi:hypothetical protein
MSRATLLLRDKEERALEAAVAVDSSTATADQLGASYVAAVAALIG